MRIAEAVGRVEKLCDPLHECRRIRLVVDPHASFFLHGVALILEVLVRHGKGSHPVRFEPQREVQPVGGDGFEVRGAVFVRGAVHAAAGTLDERHVLRLADVCRSFEHHVLEQVREAGTIQALAAAADVVPQIDGDDWSGVVLDKDDP